MNEPCRALSPPAAAWLAAGNRRTLGPRTVFTVERGSGPVVLLLHGFPTSSYDWRGVIDRLDGSYRCVACDFLGFGLSDKPDDCSYSLFDQADLVEALARQLGIEAAHVVSHDMGTSVHCELLARAQHGKLGFRIAASTFTNGSMLQWLAQITPFQELLATNATLPQAIELCAGPMEMYVPALLALMRRPEAVSEVDARVMHELLTHRDGARRIPAIAGYMRERYVHQDRWLGALAVADPLQFVWADGDPIAHVEMGREHARRAPQARYVELANLGHFLMIEDPAAVAAEIARFWSG
ncbi:MAG: alpha/beta hydrolase [Pirellulales bacterium]|nr:alpha/beta hydrolase [Pirellulales bacterium]